MTDKGAFIIKKLGDICLEDNIELYFDSRNLCKYEDELPDVVKKLENLINIMSKFREKHSLFIRIHGYMQWIVIRITVKIILSKSQIDEILGIFPDDLITISHESGQTIIKLSISK